MIPLSRPCFGVEEEEAVREVLRSGWVAQGPTSSLLEEEFARLVGVEHAVAASSCTTALHLAVVALGIGEGDEVILPSFTFPATANAVLYERARPVLVDVDRATLNLDVERAKAAVTSKTKAIVAVHLFGCPCEIEELREFCTDREVALIEDAACAVGTEVNGRPAGSFGDVACFSLHGRKVLTCGEGGILTTSDPEIAHLLRSLRTHGADLPADARHADRGSLSASAYRRLGYNYRLSDVQAAIARVQLRKLAEFVRERDEIARHYEAAFASIPGLRLPPRREGRVHSYQSFVVVLERDASLEPGAFRQALAERGVATQVGTYAVHRQSYFPAELLPGEPLPVSDEAAERSVALPLFNGMTNEQQETVVDAVRSSLGAGRGV